MVTFESLQQKEEKVAVVGLGYVGLPLAVALAKHFAVVGFDIKKDRVEELQKGVDKTNEVSSDLLRASTIEFTSDPAKLSETKFIIVAVPTPVDAGNIPDLGIVERATVMVGKNLTKDSVVVYESTVYPGVTEDICVPILEKESGLKAGTDFKVGYSPERINPGDKEHTIDRVTKVVAGMDAESTELIANVYGAITNIFKATSIKVAEAAKVIENTQRDLNIALMNELSVIFKKMDISIYDVLAAAGTKWNFLKFYPGLVGGHCIGVDPYYLTYKAQMLGYHPEVILAGRKINDSMGSWVVAEVVRHLVTTGKNPSSLKVLIAGITFKENIPDIRNSKVVDIYNGLLQYGVKPYIYDPMADATEVKHEYGIEISQLDKLPPVDVVIVAVAHDQFRAMKGSDWKKFVNGNEALLVDIKNMYNKTDIEREGLAYWRF
ncbi:MAG TPA: nucleotide sugar dehydrogenase [Patescibacteria group bacterium]|nr:nucleotide sugar dehydrogenase [Patescibacteria group bacterium]